MIKRAHPTELAGVHLAHDPIPLPLGARHRFAARRVFSVPARHFDRAFTAIVVPKGRLALAKGGVPATVVEQPNDRFDEAGVGFAAALPASGCSGILESDLKPPRFMASRVRWAIVSRLWLALLLGCLPATASLIFPGPKFARPPVDIQGGAAAAATVTVDAQSAYRHGNFYRAQLPVNNSTGPVSVAVTTTAVEHQGGVLPDLVATTGGHYFLPQSPEVYTYDLDGNLLTDGRWRYTWDGENRLVSLQPLSVAAGNQTLNFEYDSIGRRIRKTVRTITGSSSTITADTKFVYDGWNLIAELNAADNTVLRSYVWGPDLSGMLQGAGGVGGLLVARPGAGMAAQFACYDGNGNITAYVDAGTGQAASQFEYGPFGEPLRVDATAMRFGFSSKYTDPETGLVYYGYRYYNPQTGRWIGRDPIGEFGGRNLFGFVGNGSPYAIDCFGLWPTLPIWTYDWIPVGVANWIAGPAVDAPIRTKDPNENLQLLAAEFPGDYDTTLLHAAADALRAGAELNPIVGAYNNGYGAYTGTDAINYDPLTRGQRIQQGAVLAATLFPYLKVKKCPNNIRSANAAEGGAARLNIFGEGEARGFLDVSPNAQFANGRPLTSSLGNGSASDIFIRNAPITGENTISEIMRLSQPGTRITLMQPASGFQGQALIDAFGNNASVNFMRTLPSQTVAPGEDMTILRMTVGGH